MSQQDPMLGEVRFRVPLPVLIPVTAVVVIVLLTFGFSRVLLALPAEAATAVATVTALNILGACAVLASRPNISRNGMVELAVVVIYPVIIGIAIAQLGIGAQEHPIFQGEIITGTTVTYEFTAPDAGEYVFQCDVHPAMGGTVVVE